MKAYGSVATGTVGERGIDLPTAPVRRPERDLGVSHRRIRSPIPPVQREDPAAVARARQAQRDAVQAKAKADQQAAQALRVASRKEERRREREKAAQAVEQARAARPARVATPRPPAQPRPPREAKPPRDRSAEQRAARERREQAQAVLAAEVRDRYNDGEHLVDIAKAMHLSLSTVHRLRASTGVPLRRKALDRAEVVRHYADLRSVEKVAAALSTSTAAVRYQLGQAGVALRKPGDNGAARPLELRRDALARYVAGDRVADILRDLGIGESTLLRWVDAAGIPKRASGRPVSTTPASEPGGRR